MSEQSHFRLVRTLVQEETLRTPAEYPDRKLRGSSRSRKPWTLDEDDRLRISMAEGRTARTIANDSERSSRAIRRRAEILNLSWRCANKK